MTKREGGTLAVILALALGALLSMPLRDALVLVAAFFLPWIAMALLALGLDNWSKP